MNEITRILTAIGRGTPAAAQQLLPLVDDELRQPDAQWLAQEKPGQTLQTTALVYEGYLCRVGGESRQRRDSRRHPRVPDFARAAR